MKNIYIIFRILVWCVIVVSCRTETKEVIETVQTIEQKAEETQILPYSDTLNTGNWVLNKEISDEFEGTKIDTSKWFVEGQNGDYYIWKGRAPSQFAPHNVRVEDGKLKLRTQWEPDFKFAKESYADGANNDTYGEFEGKPLPITTAGIVGKKRFLNGYMEVKSKTGNAAITAAFWAIGYEQELDVYELMGNPKIDGNIKADSYLATAHDWSPPAIRPTKVFNHVENLPFRTADDFHIYGAEWGIDYLKLYIDGRLVHTVTQDEVGTDWVLNNPMEIWLDSEIFKWLGLPHKEELPVDFEVEYMRVWQKPIDNLLAPAFYGFEGPILYEDNPRPLKMVPEDSEPNDYQKFWMIDEASSKYLTIVEGDYATGVNSLQFSGYGKNEKLETDKVIALTPKGALNIPKGDFILSMKVWLDQGRITNKIHIGFEDPKIEIELDNLKSLERRKWVVIEKKISRTMASSVNDQLRIEIRKEDLPETKAAKLFIDDIAIKAIK
ncbi:family 16 glycosylhydrolase [Aquimarina algiphila]|uniref:family 16 glycosylhydrolase n=1 Tax=Aquimarina algiphila TaxID=2047982 RepID=UPI0024929636|nr:family 16 glycosylhydrolase [Aquimarina algiphila]